MFVTNKKYFETFGPTKSCYILVFDAEKMIKQKKTTTIFEIMQKGNHETPNTIRRKKQQQHRKLNTFREKKREMRFNNKLLMMRFL